MDKPTNLYQMYIQNNCQLGFFVRRDSWRSDRYAEVVAIDGVQNGEMIDGVAPYFTRYYPKGHPKEGKVWPRTITLKADWFDDGIYHTDSGGTYSWELVTI